jgi:hypothetical protein
VLTPRTAPGLRQPAVTIPTPYDSDQRGVTTQSEIVEGFAPATRYVCATCPVTPWPTLHPFTPREGAGQNRIMLYAKRLLSLPGAAATDGLPSLGGRQSYFGTTCVYPRI